jgi:hypothetical protein
MYVLCHFKIGHNYLDQKNPKPKLFMTLTYSKFELFFNPLNYNQMRVHTKIGFTKPKCEKI